MPHQSRDVEAWTRQWTPDQQERVEWLANRIQEAERGLRAGVKWRQLTFTVDDDWHNWVCAIAVTKGAVSLVLHKGALLHDPAGLLEGEGRYVRHIPYERATTAPEAVTAIVRAAHALRPGSSSP